MCIYKQCVYKKCACKKRFNSKIKKMLKKYPLINMP